MIGVITHQPREMKDECVPVLRLAFPDDQSLPAESIELLLIVVVPSDIAIKFLAPILHIGLWSACQRAILMPVPEAAMDKDDGFMQR